MGEDIPEWTRVGTSKTGNCHRCSHSPPAKMSDTETVTLKSAETPIRGCSVAQLRVSEPKGTRSLSSPQASVKGSPRSNHRQVTRAPCLSKCKVMGRQQHRGFYRYFVRASYPILTGGVSAALTPSLTTRQPLS